MGKAVNFFEIAQQVINADVNEQAKELAKSVIYSAESCVEDTEEQEDGQAQVNTLAMLGDALGEAELDEQIDYLIEALKAKKQGILEAYYAGSFVLVAGANFGEDRIAFKQ